MAQQSLQDLIRLAAAGIHDGFTNYNNNYRRITQRARHRFEQRDWAGARRDLAERIELYDKSVQRTLGALRGMLDAHIDDLGIWRAIRVLYWSRVDDVPDGEFSKTFFNSVYRDVLRSLDIEVGVVESLQHRRLHGPPAHRLSVGDLIEQVGEIALVGAGTAREYAEPGHLHLERLFPHDAVEIAFDLGFHVFPVLSHLCLTSCWPLR